MSRFAGQARIGDEAEWLDALARAAADWTARRRVAGHPRAHVGGRGNCVTVFRSPCVASSSGRATLGCAPYVLRQRRRSRPPERQDRGDPGLRLPGARPLAEPQGLRRRRRRRPAARLEVGRAGALERPRGHRRGRSRVARGHRDGAAARREARPDLAGADPRRDRARQGAVLRPRLLGPLRRGRVAPGGRRRAGRAQGPRPPRPPPVPRGQRRPRPGRGRSGRVRERAPARARLRQGHRLHARRRDRDHVQGRDRDRPVRRAGRPVRRRVGARAGRLRDARSTPATTPSSRTSSACTS